jgi:WD40 repeat protein
MPNRDKSKSCGVRWAFVVAALAVMVLRPFAIPPASAGLTTSATLIGPVPATQSVGLLAISENCHTLAMSVADYATRKMVLTLNGKTIATGDSFPQIALSPDGKRLAYFEGDAGKAFVTIDSVRDAKFDHIADDDNPGLAFSPDSRHVAFIAGTAAGWTVVLDGRPGATYSSQPTALLFSPDSQHLAVVDTSSDRQAVVLDGKEGRGYASVYDLCFSRTGGHLAYVAQVADDKYAAVVDGNEGPGYLSVTDLRFNVDGTRYGYRAMESSDPLRWRVVIDGKAGDAHYNIGAGPVFSDAGNHVAYSAYDTTPGPTIPYSVVPAEHSFLVVDGRESDVPYIARDIVYSRDGTHRGAIRQFALRSDLSRTYRWEYEPDIDGVTRGGGHPFGDTLFSAATAMAGLTFSPDGRHVAYALYDSGAWWISSNLGPPYPPEYNDVMPLTFSDDGDHLAFAGRLRSTTTWQMTFDYYYVPGYEPIRAWSDNGPLGIAGSLRTSDTEPAAYQISQVPYHFDPDGTLVFFGAKNGNIYWVQVKPGAMAATPATRP